MPEDKKDICAKRNQNLCKLKVSLVLQEWWASPRQLSYAIDAF